MALSQVLLCVERIRVGFALTGSHCCLEAVIPQLRNLINEGADIFPIISQAIDTTDTRYGSSDKWKKQLKDITGRDAMTTMVETEPIGPQKLLDVLVVAPCTGNTLAKLANGITDTAVLFSVKAHCAINCLLCWPYQPMTVSA